MSILSDFLQKYHPSVWSFLGSDEQKRKYLPDLCAGKKLWGFGLTEAEAGSDAGSSKTRAEFSRMVSIQASIPDTAKTAFQL